MQSVLGRNMTSLTQIAICKEYKPTLRPWREANKDRYEIFQR